MPLKDHITRPLLPEHHYHVYNRGNMENDIFFREENYRYFLMKYKQYMLNYWDTYAYALLPNHFHLAIRVKSEEEVLAAAVHDLQYLRKDAWERLLRMAAEMNDGAAAGGVAGGGDLTVFQKLSNLRVSMGVSTGMGVTSTKPPLLIQVIPLLSGELRVWLCAWAVSERFRRFMLGYSKAINKEQQPPRYGSLLQKPFRRKLVKDEGGFLRLIAYIHRNGVHHGYVSDIAAYRHCSYPAILSDSPTSIMRKKVLEMYGGKKGLLRFHKVIPADGFMGEDFVIEE